MQDYFKPKGQLNASKPDAGGGAIRSEPVLAIVKDNVDPTRSGRLQVYLSDFGSADSDDSSTWVTVSFMSPFYGLTPASGPKDTYGTYEQNSTSYGMWYSQPDIGTTVICIFINGDPNYGYWIGCAPSPEALHMVPAIGATSKVILNGKEADSYGGSPILPVSNINTNNASIADGADFLTKSKPVHSYVASIYNQQGLLRDPIRGPITSSAQRESPSRVGWGVSTPGRPIYKGGYDDTTVADNLDPSKSASLAVTGRRGGHSIVMDDGDLIGKDQLIRIRTATGHQIMMSDDGQCLNIMHSNGQSWIELGKEGTIDMYATNSVNIRSQGDINFHADNNININAMKDLNIAADNINVSSTTDTKFRVGGGFSNYTMGAYTVKVNGSMSMSSGGDASYAAGGAAYINGSAVNLNSGSASLTPAEVAPMTTIAHTDTLYDKKVGFAPSPGKLMSIVSRAPAHAPWANWGQGVDVKVDLGADAALPSAPSSEVAAANNAAPATPENPVTVATAATVPNVSAVSDALDKNTTAAMIGAVAKDAATGPLASAVAAGAGVVDTVSGKVAAVGSMGMSAAGMEAAGVIKAGSAALVDGAVKAGASIEKALPSNLFTGQAGATDLASFVKNTGAQVQAQITNLQQSQSALTSAGVITGKEAPGQIAGLVTAGATAGVAKTIDFVKNAGTNLIGSATSAISGAANSVSSAISSGNFAANLSGNITSGLSSLGASLTTAANSLVDNIKGVAGGAFSAITAAFKPFKAGVPQDLTAIVAKNAAAAKAASSGGLSSLTGSLSGALGSVGGSLTGALSSVTGALGSAGAGLTGALGSVGSSISGAINSVAGSVSSAATKLASSVNLNLSGLPGGQNAIASVVDNAPGAVNSVPGVAAISSLAKNTFSSATNNISGSISALGKDVAGITGTLSSGLQGAGVDLATGKIPALDSAFASTGAAGAIGSLKDKLAGGALDALKGDVTGALGKLKDNPLTSLASTGLQPEAAAKLAASISALGSGGASPIKLPTVATNTTDRSAISGQLSALLGSSKIPLPNFSGGLKIKPLSLQETEKYNNIKTQIETSTDDYYTAKKALGNAKLAFSTASNSLPQGDPQLADLKQAVDDAQAAVTMLDTKLADLRQQQANIASA